MRCVLLAVALVALATSGCGGGMAKVKGRLVSNGQPMTVPGMTVGVVFTPVGADDKPNPTKAYTAVVNEDGSFELVASGGEFPAGKYQVAITATGKMAAQLKAFAGPNSPIRREFKSGENDIVIDVAKPDGG
jgi:hypothetical protein